MAKQYYHMRYSNTTYLPEKYVRQIGRQKFMKGMLVGAVIMLMTPLYKACRDVVKCSLKSWKQENGYTDTDTSDKFKEEQFDLTKEDFEYPFSEQIKK